MAASTGPKLPTWYRVLAIIVGVFSVVLALIVLVEPLLAVWLLIFFLALALLMMGIDRLVAGISGHPFSLMMPSVGGVSGAPSGAPTGPTPPEKKP